MASTTTARAIVATKPGENHELGSNWEMQDISVPTELKKGELLVQMVSTGICHTDLLMTSNPMLQYPFVAGHEGSGIVKAIGPGVTKDVAVGDPVLLSFDNCNNCPSCKDRHPAYCHSSFPLNLMGVQGVFKDKDAENPVTGKFFGQSSFASLSIVQESSVLPAKDLVKSHDELKLLSPLGCGVQTGAGAVLNLVKARPEDRVMVLGLGGVGLGAVMAAAIAGCKQIIAVDKVQSRIDLAKSLGATHAVNTSGLEDYQAALKEATNGLGATVCIEGTVAPGDIEQGSMRLLTGSLATAFKPLVEAGIQALGHYGTFVFIGASADPQASLNLNIPQLMMKGLRIIGCIEGDVIPAEFVPQLVKHYHDGKLPIEKIVKFYKAEDFKTALHDMHSGETVKPVLIW